MISWPIHAILRPERLVSVNNMTEGHGWIQPTIESVRLLSFYSLNLALYATPLTLSGIGISGRITPTKFVESLLTNSAFLFVGTLLIFGTFHVGVVLSGKSSGLLRSLRAVTYSTGIYLALGYTLVWFISTKPQTETGSDLLIAIQGEFIYYFIDTLNVGLNLPGGRPDTVNLAGLTPIGEAVLILLAFAGLYTLYVLYVGRRIGHDANRAEALVATAFVLISPALYAVGSILYSLYV